MMHDLSRLGVYDIVELLYISGMTVERHLQERCVSLCIIGDVTLSTQAWIKY